MDLIADVIIFEYMFTVNIEHIYPPQINIIEERLLIYYASLFNFFNVYRKPFIIFIFNSDKNVYRKHYRHTNLLYPSPYVYRKHKNIFIILLNHF